MSSYKTVPDIIGISETKLTQKPTQILSLIGFGFHFVNSILHLAGVGVYVKNSIVYSIPQ